MSASPRAGRSRAVVQRLPWVKVLVTVSALLTVVTMLVINGVLTGELGSSQPNSATADVALPQGAARGWVVEGGATEPQSIPYDPKTIALTFDGGPDPRWTPAILDVLRRHGVTGTFFVLGSAVATNPELVRDIRAEGSEIGLSSFTRTDLLQASAKRAERELTLTQLTVAAATGEISYLVRPRGLPLTLTPSTDGSELMTALGDQGFVTAPADLDSEGRETSAIVDGITVSDDGLSVALPDGGRTVAALDRLIPELKAQGWTFATVTGATGLTPAASPASTHDVLAGSGLLIAAAVATHSVDVMVWCLVGVGVVMLLRLFLMLVEARRHARRTARSLRDGSRSSYVAPVSVVVPAYNEKECIAATVRSLQASRHPIEIIVVDDGSTDDTAAIVEAMAVPGLQLITQVNAGKPTALNTGIRAASHEVVVMIDGDTIFEPTTVGALVQHFGRPEVGAVAGNAKVANRSSLVARWQHIEYVMGFNLDRRVQDTWQCMVTVPGAVGAFRRDALLAVGGVSDDTLAEDTDLTMAISRAGWRVVYEESARAWTEAPATLSQLWRQRYRWSYGTIQSMWKHREAVWSAGDSGRFGRIGLLNLAAFQILLPLFAPLADVIFVYSVVRGSWAPIAAWCGMQILQLAVAAYAFRLDREKLGVLWLLPVQQFVYRQLMYAVLVQSLVTAVAGTRLRWQKLHRIGDFGAVPLAAVPEDGRAGASAVLDDNDVAESAAAPRLLVEADAVLCCV